MPEVKIACGPLAGLIMEMPESITYMAVPEGTKKDDIECNVTDNCEDLDTPEIVCSDDPEEEVMDYYVRMPDRPGEMFYVGNELEFFDDTPEVPLTPVALYGGPRDGSVLNMPDGRLVQDVDVLDEDGQTRDLTDRYVRSTPDAEMMQYAGRFPKVGV